MLSTVIELAFYNCALLFCRPGSSKNPEQGEPCSGLVEEGGFEPPKRNATDLQSAPFGHSGTPPYVVGAGGRIRTPDLLITNQLLYRLSYTSTWRLSNSKRDYSKERKGCQVEFQNFFISPLWDLQDQRPSWYCARCGEEQYRYDRAWQGRRGRLCARCFAQEKLRRDRYDVS